MTTAQAFDSFRQNVVDLKSGQGKRARQSRVYLQEQLTKIPGHDHSFPRLTGAYMPFGSFARRTKVRPLDDVDMLVMLQGGDSRVVQSSLKAYTFLVQVTSHLSPLKPYVDTNGCVNSTKILNRFKSGLNAIPNYRKSEIKRTGAAVVLNLKSYAWAFDIVPALPVGNGDGTILYYLIPHRQGTWTRTDPRIDQAMVTEANKTQFGYLLPMIRLIKYWNKENRAAPRLTSYHLETLFINAYRFNHHTIGPNLRESVPDALKVLANGVTNPCPDPKGLGPNLDATLDLQAKWSVSHAASQHAQYASSALWYEQQGQHQEAIKLWNNVFPHFG